MPQETKSATLTWVGGMRFTSPVPGDGTLLLDGKAKEGASPVVALLLAAAACSGADVVMIFEKMRIALREFSIDAQGVRREEEPRRYISMHFTFRLRGEGIDEAKARRAVELSLEKYCSVVHSLAPDLPVTYDLDLG
ncbi:MAG TPA: OsmC family protein [Gemmatimonadales bacterium]